MAAVIQGGSHEDKDRGESLVVSEENQMDIKAVRC